MDETLQLSSDTYLW